VPLRDMERRGEIEIVFLLDPHGNGLFRLLPRPWKSRGKRVYNRAGRHAATGEKSV
jgi:hypothetical protein